MRGLVFGLFAGLVSVSGAIAASDFLAEQRVPIASTRSGEILDRTISDLKSLFQRYRPALDSGTRLVSGPVVAGTADRPILQLSLRKCVAFICETVDLDAAIQARELGGRCGRNYLLLADLSRSSARVSDVYSRLDVQICYNSSPDGRGNLLLRAVANRGARYEEGFIQQEMFKLLRLQVAPIVKALQETLKAKENP